MLVANLPILFHTLYQNDLQNLISRIGCAIYGRGWSNDDLHAIIEGMREIREARDVAELIPANIKLYLESAFSSESETRFNSFPFEILLTPSVEPQFRDHLLDIFTQMWQFGVWRYHGTDAPLKINAKFNHWSASNAVRDRKVCLICAGYAARYGRLELFLSGTILTNHIDAERDGITKYISICDFDTRDIVSALKASRAHPYFVNLVRQFCRAHLNKPSHHHNYIKVYAFAQRLADSGFLDIADEIFAMLPASHDAHKFASYQQKYDDFLESARNQECDRYLRYRKNDAERELSELVISYEMKAYSHRARGNYFEMIRAMIRRYGRDAMKLQVTDQSHILYRYLARILN